jgi:hypothetical protein
MICLEYTNTALARSCELQSGYKPLFILQTATSQETVASNRKRQEDEEEPQAEFVRDLPSSDSEEFRFPKAWPTGEENQVREVSWMAGCAR